MKKIVIVGSTKPQKEINKWINFFESNDYEILDYPKAIEESKLMELYPNIHTGFP